MLFTNTKKEELSALSIEQLALKKQELDAEIALRGEQELERLKEQMILIAHALGYDAKDLFPQKPEKKERKKREAKIKYQHPENPTLTWTGRGKPPAWMQELLDGGAEKHDFAIA